MKCRSSQVLPRSDGGQAFGNKNLGPPAGSAPAGRRGAVGGRRSSFQSRPWRRSSAVRGTSGRSAGRCPSPPPRRPPAIGIKMIQSTGGPTHDDVSMQRRRRGGPRPRPAAPAAPPADSKLDPPTGHPAGRGNRPRLRAAACAWREDLLPRLESDVDGAEPAAAAASVGGLDVVDPPRRLVHLPGARWCHVHATW
jgi:hypothetical protein